MYTSEVDLYINYVSIKSLWILPGQCIRDEDKEQAEKLFSKNIDNRKQIIALSELTISDTAHPFNGIFISHLLFKLSLADRDLSWTEYIRVHSSQFEQYLEVFESECRYNNEMSEILKAKIHLASKFIQWMLTSTNRKLRDLTTRALYYYGRRFPEELFTLLLESLGCNDPYVWERMLSVQYGVILAKHNTLNNSDFKVNLLPKIALNLYELMFKKGARFFTTHTLARDYASNCIKVALKYEPALLNNHAKRRIVKPFLDGKSKVFATSSNGRNSFGGPIGMDFGNYTIGYIVKNGHSYSNPPEKIKVRGQIYNRIYELGWSEEVFGEIDKSLLDHYSDRLSRPKVERYGKKYSWIAYMEIAGHRADRGLIGDRWEEYRTSDIDLDSSFPEVGEPEKIVTDNLLGDPSLSLIDWLKKDDFPPIDKYLLLEKAGIQWVCLDGYIGQKNDKSGKERFAFLRGLLIKDSDYESIMAFLEKQDLGARWLPEIPENHYTMAGELYLFPEATASNEQTISFETGRKLRKYKKGEEGYFPDIKVHSKKGEFKIVQVFPPYIERDEIFKKDFEVLLPVMKYSWESYHSELNKCGHTDVLSKEIANELSLVNLPQSFNLIDENGDLATLNVSYDIEPNNRHHMVYIRKDVLDRYLVSKESRLVWGIWGEREANVGNGFRIDFYEANNINGYFKFHKVVNYGG